jgi:hypothetical protein
MGRAHRSDWNVDTTEGSIPERDSSALSGLQTTLAANAQLEWAAFEHHSLVLHAGDMGFLHHDYWMFGPSYRYHRGIFDASLGEAVRIYGEGRELFPVATVGVEL